jgi:hypothetical protein
MENQAFPRGGCVKESMDSLLAPLISSGDPARAMVARIFVDNPAALSCGEGDKLAAPVRERLAMLSAKGEGLLWLARICAALVEVDEILVKADLIRGPMACRYAPMLAVLVLLQNSEQALEARCRANAERAPIVSIDKDTLLAAPISPLREGGSVVFMERLLLALKRLRPKKLFLPLSGLDEEDCRRIEASGLEDELRVIKCKRVDR